MGLGLLGRGVGDSRFLAECGAKLIITDRKNSEELATSVRELEGFNNITFVLGEHRKEDFIDRDFILKAASVPLHSEFIATAEEHHVPVEMSASLVAKLSRATIVGVTGTRGKSTVTQLIYHVLQKQKRPVHLAGNVRGIATLPILKEVTEGDIVVMELDSWQLQGFGTSHQSPHISVFTAFFPDHLDYYKDMQTYFNDKANIFKYQKSTDILVMSPQARIAIDTYYQGPINSEKIVIDPLPIHNRQLSGVHNKYNAACAFEVAKQLGMEQKDILEAIDTFEGVEGRLQFVRNIKGVSIYNDNNATTPDATIAGLKALSRDRSIVLIIGGSDKGLDMSELVSEIPKHCKGIVLFEGKGTERIRSQIHALDGVVVKESVDLEQTIQYALSMAQEGDVILYSPAFASFGAFKNEYDRNDQFLNIINTLA